MLRDDGLVMDDGTTWRLAEDEYFMTTTTAHAAKVMAFLEELLQTRWTDLKVHLTSVSEQWAGVAVAGPLSREVLAACVEQPTRVSDEALPFMGVVETTMRDGILHGLHESVSPESGLSRCTCRRIWPRRDAAPVGCRPTDGRLPVWSGGAGCAQN